MDRQRVVSSNLHSVGYDPQDKILEIRFLHGGTYHYFQVPADIYEGLMAASSKGTYHHAHIKPHFRFRRIRS